MPAPSPDLHPSRIGFPGPLNGSARELGEKKSYIIEKALTAYFDLLDLKIARQRLKDLEKGKDKVIPAEKIWKELGI